MHIPPGYAILPPMAMPYAENHDVTLCIHCGTPLDVFLLVNGLLECEDQDCLDTRGDQ